MTKFKTGDRVIFLGSKSPDMIVRNVGDYDHEKDLVMCEWFDGTKIKSHAFKPESLRLWTESDAQVFFA